MTFEQMKEAAGKVLDEGSGKICYAGVDEAEMFYALAGVGASFAQRVLNAVADQMTQILGGDPGCGCVLCDVEDKTLAGFMVLMTDSATIVFEVCDDCADGRNPDDMVDEAGPKMVGILQQLRDTTIQ